MIYDKTIHELSELLDSGKLSAVEIASELINRAEKLNPVINAFITAPGADLIKAAEESDRRRSAGQKLSPFDGIPIAVKDNINTAGVRTTCGSKILSEFVPAFDASSYSKMKKMGFLLLGKTNMDEFAMGSTNETSFFGAVKNPYDTERVPGGSSGGSAAAVSAMMAPGALGSDTGGSIRQPAAFCGVTGIKPTYGRVSRYGLVAFASSLDQIGTFARSVDDAALLLAAISGHDPKDSTSVECPVDFGPGSIFDDVKGMKIGVPDEYFKGTDPEIKDMVMSRVKMLEDAGASIETISLKLTDYAIPLYYLIATAEASSNLARFDGVRYGYRSPSAKSLESLYTLSRSEGFGKEVKRRIILGTFSLSSGYYDAYYLKALKGRALLVEDYRQAFSKVDAIITPTSTSAAFKIGEMMTDPLQMYMSDILTISANLAGIPGISIPAGLNSQGLPVGLQIMGNHFEEKKILGLARFIEKNSERISPTL